MYIYITTTKRERHIIHFKWNKTWGHTDGWIAEIGEGNRVIIFYLSKLKMHIKTKKTTQFIIGSYPVEVN